MVAKPRSSPPNQTIVCWIAVAAVVLAGFMLAPFGVLNPTAEHNPLPKVYENFVETQRRLDDQFREYVVEDGTPVLIRLHENVSASTYVPEPGELQHVEELKLNFSSIAAISRWSRQLDPPLKSVQRLSIRISPAEAELLAEALSDLSRAVPALTSLHLETRWSSCTAPQLGDLFPELRELAVIGFDCQGRVGTMLGRAELTSLTIAHRIVPYQHREAVSALSLTKNDLRAIASLDQLQRLSLISCIESASELNDLLLETELKELNLCCNEFDSISDCQSLETLRIGWTAIHRLGLTEIAKLTNLHTLVFHKCYPPITVKVPDYSFQPPPGLKQLTVRNARPSDGMLPLIQKNIWPNVDISMEVFLPRDAGEVSKLGNVNHLELICDLGQGADFVSAVSQLEQLKSLKCAVNEDAVDVLPRLFQMKSLQNLDLQFDFRHRVDNLKWEEILAKIAVSKPRKLREIALRNYEARFRGTVFCRLCSLLPELQSATIEGPIVDGDDLWWLRRCRKLSSLNLEDCLLESGVEDGLANLRSLQNLDLEWNTYRKQSGSSDQCEHLRQLHLVAESPQLLNRFCADRLLIGEPEPYEDHTLSWFSGGE